MASATRLGGEAVDDDLEHGDGVGSELALHAPAQRRAVGVVGRGDGMPCTWSRPWSPSARCRRETA